MKKKLKELIENAPIKRKGTFADFMLVSTGKKYDGFFGTNGYDSMLLLGRDVNDNEYKIITNYADTLTLYQSYVSFDIPTQYGCVRFWGREPITIDNSFDCSSILEEKQFDI